MGGRHPKRWRALLGLSGVLFVLGCVAASPFLILQPWLFELVVLFGLSVTVAAVCWAQWFESKRRSVLAIQQLLAALTIVGFLFMGGPLAWLALSFDPPRTGHTWDLNANVKVDLVKGADIGGSCMYLRARRGPFVLEREFWRSRCMAGTFTVNLEVVDSNCTVSGSVSAGDSLPDSLDEESIVFSPSCAAVERPA
jgi:hypothetical protein